MSALSTIGAGRLGIMLNELRLPSMKAMWADFAARADKEGWPAARIERHLVEARLPPDKMLDSFDFDAVLML